MLKKDSYLIYTAISALYLGIAFYLSIFNTMHYIWILIPLLILFALIINSLTKILVETKIKKNNVNEKNPIAVFVCVFAIILIGQLFYWLSYYPGGFNLDAYGQWDQVHGYMRWNNWHPVLTTFIYWLLTRFYDSFAFCIGFQIVIFTLTISILLLCLYKNNISEKLIMIIAAFISFNPSIALNNICMIKDAVFTISIILIFITEYKILKSNGEWLKKL